MWILMSENIFFHESVVVTTYTNEIVPVTLGLC